MKTIKISNLTKGINGAKLMSKFKSIPPFVYMITAVVIVIGLAFWLTDTIGWLLLFALFVALIAAFFFPRRAVELVKELDTRGREHWKVVRESAAEAWKIVTSKGSSGGGSGSGTTTP